MAYVRDRDLVLDPVFGDLARALSPRCLGRRRADGGEDLVRFSVRTLALHEMTFEYSGADSETGLARVERIENSAGRTEIDHEWEHFDLNGLICPGSADEVLCQAHLGWESVPGPLRIQGVVNVTPDSFSDGGTHLDPSRAVESALALVAEGADLLDVGGESTRPRSEPVPLEEELRRVVPVITALAKQTRVPISVDTTKSAVARAALDAGATIVNDVSAGRFDPAMFAVVAGRGAGYVAMHMQGDPRTMQDAPHYGDVVAEVTDFLRERCFRALEAGIDRAQLWIDPGIGFGKTLEHNLELLRRLRELRSLGLPILLGVSRKAFITKITGTDTPPAQRVGGTAAALTVGVQNGAEILRVHDVAIMREAALVARTLASND
jgi:dihydropteroate synthase